jgi:Putative Ig domain
MRKRMAVVGLLLSLLMLFGCPKNGSATLLSVTPNVIATGSPDTQLHIVGKNLSTPANVAWFEGSLTKLATTFVDSTDLTAIVPASLLETAGTAQIFAQVGANQSTTVSLTITIGNVAPTLTGITPAHVIVGAAPPTITLTGTNFNSSSVVNWNTTALPTTLVSATTLTATVSAANFATPGTESITVVNGGTGGGTSAAMNFIVVGKLAITTTTLPGGSIGIAYSATLALSGGTAPFTWSIASGSLPAGLALNSATGVISGTPTAAGSSVFTIQVVDATGSLARRRF